MDKLLIDLVYRSSSYTIKLQILVTTSEFEPTSMLITKQLAPVAINEYPAPQQNLWLFNPYSTDIKLGLVSNCDELKLACDEILVKSRQSCPLLLTFTPKCVGSHEVN